jgi:hypothetical protein
MLGLTEEQEDQMSAQRHDDQDGSDTTTTTTTTTASTAVSTPFFSFTFFYLSPDPTNAVWALVHKTDSSPSLVDHKRISHARIKADIRNG